MSKTLRELEDEVFPHPHTGIDLVNGLPKQVGGNHYSSMKIQPVEYITKNNLGYLEGNVIKYISRYKNKNGIEDVQKAIHYCELILAELKGQQ